MRCALKRTLQSLTAGIMFCTIILACSQKIPGEQTPGNTPGNGTNDPSGQFTAHVLPTDNAQFGTDITITFTQPVITCNDWSISAGAASTYTKNYIYKYWNENATELTLHHLTPWPANSSVDIALFNIREASDMAPLEGNTHFTVRYSPAFAAIVSPDEYDIDVPPSTDIEVFFSKPTMTNNGWRVQIDAAEYNQFSTEATWNPAMTKLIINPAADISPGMHTITLSDFNSYDGASLAKTTSFTTYVNAITNPNAIDLQYVHGGAYSMGDIKNEFPNNMYGMKPAHFVEVDSFFIGKNEITYEQWTTIRAWAASNGYTDLIEGARGGGASEDAQNRCVESTQPVTTVSWYDAVKWCNALSEKEGLTPCYYTDTTRTAVYRTGIINLNNDCVEWNAGGYRLPTEAEWEYAAKGGPHTHNYSYSGSNRHTMGGNESWFFDYGWCYLFSDHAGDITYQRTIPVGSLLPNELGLYDMTGNVMEMCWDYYDPAYYQYCLDNTVADNPHGSVSPPDSSIRITRGGEWNNHDILYLLNAVRYPYWADNRHTNAGFRICRKS